MPDLPRLPRSGRSLTRVETLACVLALGIIYFALVGWTNSVRDAARREGVVRALATLNRAMEEFRRIEGRYPPDADDTSAEQSVAALMRLPSTRAVMAAVPHAAWSRDIPWRLVDTWGTPYRCLGPTDAPARVAAADGRPVFVSAGPDRDFGDRRAAGLGDNIASDDPAVLDQSPSPASHPAPQKAGRRASN